MPDEAAANSAQLLFGESQNARFPNPEIAGGQIALIATNNNPVRVPPPWLDRMHVSLSKQIGFNERVMKAEEKTAAINSGLADFIQDLSFGPAEPVVVCVNVDHTMCGNQPVAGQLWKQRNREMTATNKPLERMDDGNESVALSAILEALSWRYALEMTSDPNYQRCGQRIIVYPKLLSKLEIVVTTGNVGYDLSGGHDVAYERIMEESNGWRDGYKPIIVR
jgi:hypothetical protein